MLTRAGCLLLLTSAGFLLTSANPDCGGVLLPGVNHRILQYSRLVTDSVNGTKCSWILQVPSSETVELEILSYQTVSWAEASCTSAYLAIQLGPTQKERRFCGLFWSVPEVGRKLVIRGKGPGVITLHAAASGMKQGFTLRYSVFVPDADHREIDTRALVLPTTTPLLSLVWGKGKQVDLSQGEAVTFPTSTGQGQQLILEYPSTPTVQERQGPLWTYQSSSSPGNPKLPAHSSDRGLGTRAQSEPGNIPATKDSQSDSRATLHPKCLETQNSPETPKTSQGLANHKIAAVSDSSPSPHSKPISIPRSASLSSPGLSPASLSSPGSSPTSLSGPGPSPASLSGPGPSPSSLSGPGPSPTSLSGPGPSPTSLSIPGLSPASLSGPGPSPTSLSGPGPSPTSLSGPGPSPTSFSGPGPSPTSLSGPGPRPTSLSSPSLSPASLSSPGSRPDSLSGPGPSPTSLSGSGPSSASLSGPGPSPASLSGPGPSPTSLSSPSPSPTSLSGPGPSSTSLSGPGPSPVSLSGPGPSPTSLSGPGPSPVSLSGPGLSSTSLSGPGPSPTSLSGPGPSPVSLSGPGLSPTSLSGPGLSLTSLSGPGLSPASISGPSMSSGSTLTPNSRSNLNSTLTPSPNFLFSLLLPDNITMINNTQLLSLKKSLAPSSAPQNKDQENVMGQGRTKLSGQPVLDSPEAPWTMFPTSRTEPSSGQQPLLTGTWMVGLTEMNMSGEDVDTRSDANTHLVSTSPGRPKSQPKFSTELLTNASPKTVQASTTQSAGRIPPPFATAFKFSSVTASISGDEVSLGQQKNRQWDFSRPHDVTVLAGHKVEQVTRSQPQYEVKVPVTLSTAAHDLSTHLSILADEEVVEMFPGSGSVSKVERSSTAGDTAQTESQDQSSLLGVSASPNKLITPQSKQDRKQENESEQYMPFSSQTTDIPTSELLSTQNTNTQNLINSPKMDSAAGAVNQLDTTHWKLDFKGTSSTFDGTITPALSQEMIKPVSSSWNMFEVPELMTHSSNLPVQEVTNGPETDTATLSYESGYSSSARLSEIFSAAASPGGAITTQRARSWLPVTDENTPTTQGVSSTNRNPSSISFTPGVSLSAISVDVSGSEMVPSEVTGHSGGGTGRGSEIESARDTTVEDSGNVTLFTFTKDRMTKVLATRSQRLEVTPRAKCSSGISLISGLPGTEKDGSGINTLRDSATEMMATTEPSGKTLWFEGESNSASNSGGENMAGSPTRGNIAPGVRIPTFSPRTPASEPITPHSPANISAPPAEVDRSISPPKGIFPTSLSFTWFPRRSSTSLQGSPSLTSSRGTIAPNSSKTSMPKSDNPTSSSGRTIEPQTSDAERLRETSASAMNQTFQEVTELSRPTVASTTPSYTPGPLDQTRSDTRSPTSLLLSVLTHSAISVTNLAQLLPSASTFETASQPSSDQTDMGRSQTIGRSSGVSDSEEPALPTTVNLKFTTPPTVFTPAEEEFAASVGPPLLWTLWVNQLGSLPNDGSPESSVTHAGTKDLNSELSQSAESGVNERWQGKILSTPTVVHSATTEGFWTWSQSDFGTESTSSGVVPTLGSSASSERDASLSAVTMISKSVITHRIPTTSTPSSDNGWTLDRDSSWTTSRDGTSLTSPTPGIGTLVSLMPTPQPLHPSVDLPLSSIPSERALQTTMHQHTAGTLGEVMNSVPSFTPTEKHKQIFIVENERPLIKEGVTVKIPAKLVLDMSFTLPLGDPTSEEYQNLAEDFKYKPVFAARGAC
ncbi:mucin-2 isoform X2 [Heterodontus francisci]|uniref:mucin-2 isoform X2 n=1 Tax=Heterodontus francisci TaxID=7792 RepID=UPI00355B9FFD